MKKAFTLIEILVVVTIISLLTTVTSITYSQFSKQGRDAKRKTDLEQIRAALEMYRSNNDQYSAYTGNCSSYVALTGSPKYIGSMPIDPKSDYFYYCNITISDYTVAAYLESATTTCSVSVSCGISNCNYCLDAYGQK